MSLRLCFADDILYKIELTAEFSESDYNGCFNQYKNITFALDLQFSKFKSKFEIRIKNEKVGEGYDYEIQNNIKELEKSNSTIRMKFNGISFGYSFAEKDLLHSTNVYVLQYSQINLFLTKLDSRAY